MYRVHTEHFSEWLFGLVCDQAKRCPWRCSVASRFSSLCFLLRPPSGAGRFCRCGGGGVPADFGAGFFSQLFLGKFRGLQSRGAASSPARRTQPGTVGQEVRDLFRELVDLGNGLRMLAPGQCGGSGHRGADQMGPSTALALNEAHSACAMAGLQSAVTAALP